MLRAFSRSTSDRWSGCEVVSGECLVCRPDGVVFMVARLWPFPGPATTRAKQYEKDDANGRGNDDFCNVDRTVISLLRRGAGSCRATAG